VRKGKLAGVEKPAAEKGNAQINPKFPISLTLVGTHWGKRLKKTKGEEEGRREKISEK